MIGISSGSFSPMREPPISLTAFFGLRADLDFALTAFNGRAR